MSGESITIALPKAQGGNVTFRGGSGAEKGGAIIFELPDATEFIRIEANGDFLVRGDRVETDRAMYVAMRHWLDLTGIAP